MLVFNIVDWILFVIALINVLYLSIFAVVSIFRYHPKIKKAQSFKRIAVLIPAYKEDEVIMECAESSLAQQYPQDKYDVVVISDRMRDTTNEQLSLLPIKLVKVNFENSTKSKSLRAAMEQIGDNYDIAVVLDADNTVDAAFLSNINDAFSCDKVRVLQAHRCAKNTNTTLAVLDAASEEINNGIFRKGHAMVGLSAALIGSGMAFDYALFKSTMGTIDAVGGFDRALELNLLRRGIRIHYLPDVDVLDEKVQHSGDFSRQRRRWLSAQIHYFGRAVGEVPQAIMEGRWDFCDKVFQQMSVPRVMLLGFCFLLALGVSIADVASGVKWWVLFVMLTGSLVIAIPKRMINKDLLLALMRLPYFFVLMVANIFKLKGANKSFIHTKHGIK